MLIICIFLVQHGRKSTREYQTLLLIALHDSYHFFCVLCAHTLLIHCIPGVLKVLAIRVAKK